MSFTTHIPQKWYGKLNFRSDYPSEGSLDLPLFLEICCVMAHHNPTHPMIYMKIGTSQFHFISTTCLLSTEGDTREMLVSNYCVWIKMQDYIVKPMIMCTSKLVI